MNQVPDETQGRARHGPSLGLARLGRIACVCVVLLATVGITLRLWIDGADQLNGSVRTAGGDREYLLHVPASYDPGTPTPLVLSFHGAAMWPAAQARLSGFDELADEFGFIVVYPAGRALPFGPRIWSAEPGQGLDEDLEFISDLLDQLEDGYNIDPSRIYATGFSLGGETAHALSCTLGKRVSAVGIVAGAHTLPRDWCPEAAPIPTISFHGTADPMAPYTGGPSGDPLSPRRLPSVLDWTSRQAQRNGCDAHPVERIETDNVTRQDYGGCPGFDAVTLYTLHGQGHAWPGGAPLAPWLLGPNNQEVDASRRIWFFFEELHSVQLTMGERPAPE